VRASWRRNVSIRREFEGKPYHLRRLDGGYDG
jgi:hypothetical protein